MKSKDLRNDESLFSNEEDFLASAQRLLEQRDKSGTDWKEAYQEIVERYGKLLSQSRKLVKISDLAQKNLKKANARIQEMADTDKLTRLPNRRGSLKHLDRELKNLERSGSELALFMMDVDFFKVINDSFGHGAGDHVLRFLAADIRSALRLQDILGRWGGEEFILILPETDREGAAVLSEKIRLRIEQTPIFWQGEKISLTMSMGGTLYDKTLHIDANIERADKALYESKANGRNRISFYERR